MGTTVSPSSPPTSAIALSGVPETMLWPLWNRAMEHRRKDRLIDDPLAAELVARIDYDFARRFGKASVFHPIRARICDDLIRRYLEQSNRPVVVALGDGLETQIWRVAHDQATWISVDLPEAVEVRQSLLPAHPRSAVVACSALDPAWMDAVPNGASPFITAAGLLMYFEEAEVRRLLMRIAERFPGAEVFFDTITPHISNKTRTGLKVTPHYTAPPMPWGITLDDLPGFLRAIPRLAPVAVQSYADPFPKRTRLYRLLSHIPAIRRRYAGGLVHCQIQSTPA